MSIPLSVQTNPTQNSHDHLEKPTNIDNMEDVHLHMALPLQKSGEFSTLWRTSELHIKKKDSTAAIGPLGLLGFGLTTFLLNLGNAGVFDMAPPVLAMGICYGGLAQLIAPGEKWLGKISAE